MIEQSSQEHILITGGAGYIGSMLTGELLRLGYRVTVVDDLLFGGESLLAYLSNEKFRFVKTNVWEPRAIRKAVDENWPTPSAVISPGCYRRFSCLSGSRSPSCLAL
jgi:UDP-glucose 4-epimerase